MDVLENTENEDLQEQDVSENGTEPEESPAESIPVSETENTSSTVSDELCAEILTEIKTGNEILGRMYALNVFMLAIMFSVMMYLIIKNNITKHF